MTLRLKVCVAGATGWVGTPLCVAIAAASDLTLVGAVSRTRRGQNLKDGGGESSTDLIVSGSVKDALATQTDVLVDFTNAQAAKDHVMAAIREGVHVVVGSSGLTDDDYDEINRVASENKVGVVAAGNFAITAVLLQRFACEAAKYLFQREIVDYSKDSKVDAPSGTARELAFRLAEIRRPEVTQAVEETIGERESRGATLNGSQIHSIRLPGYNNSLEVIFGAKDERLSIRHDAGSEAGPYIQGTLLAIRKVRNQIGLVRGLDKIM